MSSKRLAEETGLAASRIRCLLMNPRPNGVTSPYAESSPPRWFSEPATGMPAERTDLIHAVHERIVVAGPTFVSARLTPTAHEHGLALALPEVVMARPTVSEFTT